MLTLISNSDLRSELEALRQDLYRHQDDMIRGGPHFEAKVELYKIKIARLDVFQAFVNAHFIISKMEQSAVYAAQVKRRYRRRKNGQPAEIQPTCPELTPLITPTNTVPMPGPVPSLQSNVNVENIQMTIVDDSQSRKRKRSRGDRRRGKKAKLLEVKLEDIKQEIE